MIANTADWPVVYVILLTWNDRETALRCLRSIQEADYPARQVLVVDNASEDGTADAVRTEFPDCRLMVNARNLGFGAGCNVGIRAALDEGADFVMLINQDTLIDPDIFQSLVEAARRRPKAGILAPKTYFLSKTPDGRERLLYGGSWQFRFPLQQRIPGIGLPDDGSHDTPGRVDFAWGHGLFLRAEMLREIGLFDEAFFMYFEDLDLCRRAREAGYEIWYVPEALMWHDTTDGARSDNPERWRFRYKTNSMLIFYQKYYGRWRGHLLTGLHIFDEARQMWQRGHRAGARILLQAWFYTLTRWK